MALWQWFRDTLRGYPELAIKLAPALGYGMPYAIGNTLLTIFGMVIVLMLVGGS